MYIDCNIITFQCFRQNLPTGMSHIKCSNGFEANHKHSKCLEHLMPGEYHIFKSKTIPNDIRIPEIPAEPTVDIE